VPMIKSGSTPRKRVAGMGTENVFTDQRRLKLKQIAGGKSSIDERYIKPFELDMLTRAQQKVVRMLQAQLGEIKDIEPTGGNGVRLTYSQRLWRGDLRPKAQEMLKKVRNLKAVSVNPDGTTVVTIG
jgi:hypothetical protein